MYYGKESVGKYRLLRTKKWDKPYPSDLLLGEGVHGLSGQDAVGLTELSLILTDSFIRLLLGRTVYLVNPGFELTGATF